ncbi:MAG: hypothetical protein QF890_06495 [Myxococcota bacterium]|jgi:hypothetical protein|nr:hypothetical protein [Deltaproteobacteria bacterium]MCP4244042.1 hypothetical protein [bacterium]MDP6076304.1 hypothetical protein [Myxococcota bacterium]MDP6243277.1 hypothetical protein [Myxococcota bacterium]MDP7074850.1 hypothetical protein [Myxococcota bacterium]
MAQLSRGRTHALTAVVVLSAALGLAPAASAEVGLAGSWHVLVHYKDDATSHPERERWLDRLWVFEEKNGKLYWTEYPIVVFSDETGRFERRSSGQYARVLGNWEPSETQESNIQAGLQTNSRGSKKKKLKGSDAEGWKTTYRARPGSASVVTYQENWSIAKEGGLPVFVQEDVMASTRTESLEGVTRYSTQGVDRGGDVLVGSYERDGTRHGSFRMTRSGGAIPLEKRDQREIQADAVRRSGFSERSPEAPED